jgi:hypothetical protein
MLLFSAMLLYTSCIEEFDETNFAPTAELVSPEPGTVFSEGELVTLHAQVSDGTSFPAELFVRWQSDVDGVLFEGYPDGDGTVMASTRDLSRGEHSTSVYVEDPQGLSDSLGLVLSINGLPLQPEVEITPASPDTGDDLRVRVRVGDDPDGDTVTMGIEWFRDGVLAEGETGDTLSASLTTSGEEWSVKATPTDGTTEGPSATAYAIVGNQGPSVSEVGISPAEGITTGSLLSCSATAADADEEGLLPAYGWRTMVDGFFTDFSAEGGSFALDPGIVQPSDKVYCTATATDSEGAQAEGSAWVVVGNSPPSISHVLVLHDGEVLTGTELVCAAGADDPDQEEPAIGYLWQRNGSTIALGESLLLNEYNAAQGDVISCVATATDGHGGSSSSSAEVSVANSPPYLDGIGLSPSPPSSQDSLVCTATGGDIDGDGISVSYGWTVDGVLLPTTGSLFGEPLSVGETVTCTATPSDGTDDGEPLSASVTVANTPPSVDLLELLPETAGTDGLFSATAEVSDVDGDAVSLRYDWYVDGELAKSGPGSSLDGRLDFSKGQQIHVVATPSDGTEEGVGVVSGLRTVSNTLPEVLLAQLAPTPAHTDEELTVGSVATSDADGDSVTLAYQWYLDGVLVQDGGDSSLDAGIHVHGQLVTVEVVPHDGEEYGESYSAGPLEISNRLPVVESLAVIPSAPSSQELLFCAAAGSDIDGDEVSFSYSWTLDGALLEDSSHSAGPFPAGSEAICVATPSDGTGEGVAATASATVSNTPPAVEAVFLGPDPVYTGSVLVVSSETSDPDGEAVVATYAWYVDGVLVKTGLGNSLDGANFSKGQQVYVSATPSDGTQDGQAAVSEIITISNSPPVVGLALLGPSPLYAGDAVSAGSVSVSDEDGDATTLTYTWYVDGLPVQTGGDFSLDASYYAKGQAVHVEVTAHDGEEAGDAYVSGTATVANSLPSMEYLAIVPNGPTAEDQLECVATGSDPDGDALSFSYAWSVDGVPQPGEDAQAYGGIPAKGSTVACSAVPDDGDGTGASLSAEALIGNSPPRVLSLSIQGTPYTDSVLQAVAEVSDADPADALSLSYDWSVDGEVVKSGAGDTLDGAEFFSKGQQVSVSATAGDGEVESSPLASEALAILNSPPTSPQAEISDGYITLGDDLLCSIGASSDPDGDALSYAIQWALDGEDWEGLTESSVWEGDGIEGQVVSSGEVWSCTATAFDGEGYSGEAAAEATVTACQVEAYYDIVEDFDDLNALHDCWSTGWNSASDQEVVLDLFTETEDIYGYALQYLGNGTICSDPRYGCASEALMRNKADTYLATWPAACCWNITYTYMEGDSLNFLPGDSYLYLRWTAPVAARCQVDLFFTGLSYHNVTYNGATAVSLQLMQNNQERVAASLSGYGVSESISDLLDVEGGDTVDIVLNGGEGGGMATDWTQISGGIYCDFSPADEGDTGGTDTGGADTGSVPGDTGSSPADTGSDTGTSSTDSGE